MKIRSSLIVGFPYLLVAPVFGRSLPQELPTAGNITANSQRLLSKQKKKKKKKKNDETCSGANEFSFTCLHEFTEEPEDIEDFASTFKDIYNGFAGCDGLNKFIKSFTILDSKVNRNGMSFPLERRHLQLQPYSFENFLFLIQYDADCDCPAETPGFGGGIGVPTRALRGLGSQSTSIGEHRRLGRKKSSSEDSSDAEDGGGMCMCPAGRENDSVTLDDIGEGLMDMGEEAIPTTREVVQTDDCDETLMNENPVQFKDIAYFQLGGSGSDDLPTDVELGAATNAALTAYNALSFERCQNDHIVCTGVTAEYVPDDDMTRKRQLGNISPKHRRLQLLPTFLFEFSFDCYSDNCPDEPVGFFGTPGTSASRALDTAKMRREEGLYLSRRRTTQVALEGCYCPAGVQPTDDPIADDELADRFVDVLNEITMMDPNYTGGNITVPENPMFDQTGACRDLLESESELSRPCRIFSSSGCYSGPFVKDGREILFCQTCRNDLSDESEEETEVNFEQACCDGLVTESSTGETEMSVLTVLDNDLYCSICSSIESDIRPDFYVEQCCSGENIDTEKCCSDNLPPGALPDVCCSLEEKPRGCEFCMSLIEFTEGWEFVVSEETTLEQTQAAFCSLCGPSQGAPDMTYDGVTGPSKLDYLQLCEAFCFPEEEEEGGVGEGDFDMPIFDMPISFRPYFVVSDCCNAVDQVSEGPLLDTLLESCCSGGPFGLPFGLPDLCCATTVPAGDLSPRCPAFCSSQIKMVEGSWVFKESSNSGSFCQRCGPESEVEPNDIPYDGTSFMSSDFGGLCEEGT